MWKLLILYIKNKSECQPDSSLSQAWVKLESSLNQAWVKPESILSQAWVKLESSLSHAWVKPESSLSQEYLIRQRISIIVFSLPKFEQYIKYIIIFDI